MKMMWEVSPFAKKCSGFSCAVESVTQDIEQYTIDALYTNSYTNNTVGIQCSNPVWTVM